jgi:hypothetical protein
LQRLLAQRFSHRANYLASNSPISNFLSKSPRAVRYLPATACRATLPPSKSTRRYLSAVTLQELWYWAVRHKENSSSDYLPSDSLTEQITCRETLPVVILQATRPELCHCAARHTEIQSKEEREGGSKSSNASHTMQITCRASSKLLVLLRIVQTFGWWILFLHLCFRNNGGIPSLAHPSAEKRHRNCKSCCTSFKSAVFVSIGLEVRDNKHNLMFPTDRGNDPTIDSDKTERVDRERGTESSNRDGSGPLHGDQWTLVQNPHRAWKKGNEVIKDGLV